MAKLSTLQLHFDFASENADALLVTLHPFFEVIAGRRLKLPTAIAFDSIEQYDDFDGIGVMGTSDVRRAHRGKFEKGKKSQDGLGYAIVDEQTSYSGYVDFHIWFFDKGKMVSARKRHRATQVSLEVRATKKEHEAIRDLCDTL